jgi:hypothetical protein
MTKSDSARVITGQADVTPMDESNLMAEIVAAHERGWEIETYLQARAIGLGDAALCWAEQQLNLDLAMYVEGHRSGCSDAELAEIRRNGIGMATYVRGRQCGVSHEQYMEAVSVMKVGQGPFAGASMSGAYEGRGLRS